MPAEGYLSNLVSKSANYSPTQIADQCVRVTAAATMTLPAANTCFPGQQMMFLNDIASGGLITLAPTGADTINGANSSLASLTPQYSTLVATTDGSSKWIVSQASVAPETRTIVDASGAGTASHNIYTAPNDGTTWQVVSVSARFATASSSGTLQVEVAGAAIARASGTNQLTGTVSLAGTADTTVNGTVIASPTTVAAGTSINVIFGGTMTSIAGLIITVVLKRLT